MSSLLCQFQVNVKPVKDEESRELILTEEGETKDSQRILASLGTEYLCSHPHEVSYSSC
jgi:hypothetical protein